MVEPLKELGPLCQKPDYKVRGNWMVRTFLRDLALPITRILLHTPITANQVTLISICVAAAGMVMTACRANGFFLIGVILYQAWYLLDHVDGQIARYRKTAGLTGRFYDFIMHHFVHAGMVFAFSLYAWNETGLTLCVFWGFVTTISLILFNLIYDTMAKTFLEQVDAGKATLRSVPEPAEDEEESPKPSWLKRGFSLLHKSAEVHVMMNLATAGAIIQIFFNSSVDARMIFFLYYGIACPVLFITKLIYILRTRQVDQEFSKRFEYLSSEEGESDS